MASTSSRSSARLRDKDKVVRGAAAGRDIAEAPVRSSRTTRRSNPEPQLQYTTINNVYGDIQITKGPLFGRALDEDSGPSQRSHPALPGRQNVYAAAAPRPRRIIADEDDDTREESDDIESSRNFSGEDEPSNALLLSRATPTPAQQVQTDSGYRSATRRSKQGKKEAYRASLNKKLSNAPLRESHSSHKKRKTKPRAVESNESNNEDSATSDDNEKHLATQGDDEGDGEDGGNDDDSDDDDFARRQMKVATFDNEAVAANVLLDTGTKPDWISNYFLTEKLHRKYTRLNDEESKREYIDFNGNKFNAVGKAELMIYSTDFSGFSCRTLSFLVATGRNFEIILGKRTTQKEKLLCRRLDPQMEGAYPAVQTDIKKAERSVIAQKKDNQNKLGTERDKMREDARKSKTKEKKEPKSSSSLAVRLAREYKPRRRSASPSPSRNAKHVAKPPNSSWKKTKPPVRERSSSTSSSGGGAAVND